jgi:hypothetical protein
MPSVSRSESGWELLKRVGLSHLRGDLSRFAGAAGVGLAFQNVSFRRQFARLANKHLWGDLRKSAEQFHKEGHAE